MALLHTISREFCIASVVINNTIRSNSTIGVKSLGKKLKKGDEISVQKEVEIPVETDCEKLLNYVCGTNLMAENGENIKIKPDSEYPEWLWTIHTGPPKELKDFDPNSMEYWRLVRKIGFEMQKLLDAEKPTKRDYK